MKYDLKVNSAPEAFALLDETLEAIASYNELESTGVTDFVNVVAAVNTSKPALENGNNNFVFASVLHAGVAMHMLSTYLLKMIVQTDDKEMAEDMIVSALSLAGIDFSDEFVAKARKVREEALTQVKSSTKQ